MIRTYIRYAIVLLFVLALLGLCAFLAFRRFRAWRLRRLLPYTDIEGEVENMNQYYSKGYIDSFILQYFREGDNLSRAKAARRAGK